MRFLPVNLDALLIELEDLDETLALLDSLNGDPLPGVLELIPAARTILVSFMPSRTNARAIRENIAGRSLGRVTRGDGVLVELPVRYSGEDLAEVGTLLGVTPEEVIALHTGRDYTVAFTGFAPGFAYLAGGHPALDVPRRATPRTRIPAGAVGLAGTFSGVYPQASPGGWQIIGVTDVPMWDLNREVPALLQPGFRVRFRDAGAGAAVDPIITGAAAGTVAAPAAAHTITAPARSAAAVLEVLTPGMQTLFQDLGRPGQARQGVSAAGALDRRSLRAANRLVGNDPAAPTLEIVYGGLSVRALLPVVLAITGAEAGALITAESGHTRTAGPGVPFALAAGESLELSAPTRGLRSYLAVRGGFAVQPVLGSASTDTLARVGPEPVAAGDTLHARVEAGPRSSVDAGYDPGPSYPAAGEIVELDVVLGPRTDWFTPAAVAALAEQEWTVTPQSNRVGLRLAGETALEREITHELPSEGTVVGSIQVPASGQPVLFLADHPLTGGYPVIGAIAPHHLDLAGQIPIGARIRFRPITRFTEDQS